MTWQLATDTWGAVTPEIVRAWIRVLRDFLLVLTGLYIVLHEVHQDGDPRIEWIVAALAFFGLPPVLRADEWLRERNGKDHNGKDRS